MKFKLIDHKTIFRTQSGKQAFYGKVIKLTESEYICSVIMGSKIESLDSHTEILRSTDGGLTWQKEGAIISSEKERKKFTEIGFININHSGSLFYTAARWKNYGQQKNVPLINAKTIGMKDNEMLFRTTKDNGKTWSAPQIIPKTMNVPVEVPSSPFILNNTTTILPFAAWKKWDGTCPYGHNIYAIKSNREMTQWTEPVRVISSKDNRIGFWEPRIARLNKSTLIATCWAHDWYKDIDIENHFTLSSDEGNTWEGPFKSKVKGQTGFPLRIKENVIFFAYNYRRKPAGIRGQIAEIYNEKWNVIFDELIWSPQNKEKGTISKDNYGVANFQFGWPSALFIAQKHIMITYWAVENGQAGIEYSIIELI